VRFDAPMTGFSRGDGQGAAWVTTCAVGRWAYGKDLHPGSRPTPHHPRAIWRLGSSAALLRCCPRVCQMSFSDPSSTLTTVPSRSSRSSSSPWLPRPLTSRLTFTGSVAGFAVAGDGEVRQLPSGPGGLGDDRAQSALVVGVHDPHRGGEELRPGKDCGESWQDEHDDVVQGCGRECDEDQSGSGCHADGRGPARPMTRSLALGRRRVGRRSGRLRECRCRRRSGPRPGWGRWIRLSFREDHRNRTSIRA